MTISTELLLAYIATCAAAVTAVVALFRWAENQERARHEQARREIRSEVLAEVYSRLLELNVAWLSSSPDQREKLQDLAKNHTAAPTAPADRG